MFVFAIEGMAASLLAGDASDACIFTVDILAGKGKGDPGLIQTAVVKKTFDSWLLQYSSSQIMSPCSGGALRHC